MSHVWRGFVFWREYQTLRWEFGLVVWGLGFRAWFGPWSFVMRRVGKQHKVTYPQGARGPRSFPAATSYDDEPKRILFDSYPPIPRQLPPPPPPPPPERNPTARINAPSIPPCNMTPPSQRPMRFDSATLTPPGGGSPVDVMARRHITGAQQVTISGAAVARWGDGLEVMRMFQQPGSKRLMLQIEWQGKKSQVYIGPRVAKLFKVKA